MPRITKKINPDDALVRAVHAYSGEAYALARALVGGDASEALRQKARDLKARLPEAVAQMNKASEAHRADLNMALSEARLDIAYVIAGGNRPSSMRLAHVIREPAAGVPPAVKKN